VTRQHTNRRGGLLRQRDFRLLWIGETISGAGNAMAVIGVPLLAVTVLHASTFAVSALTAAAYLPWLLIGLPAGAWVDRLPARPLMIACDVLSVLLYASLPVAAWLGLLSIGQLGAVALLTGAVSVLFTTAYQVLLPSLVATHELAEGNARLQGGAQVAAIAGRGLAGVAAQAVGAATALLFNAASFAVSAACLLRISTAPPDRKGEREGRRLTTIRAETWQGIQYVAGDPYLRRFTLYGGIANLAYTGNTALVLLFLVRVVRLDPAAVGLLIATAGIGGVLGTLAAGPLIRTLGSARALVASALCTGLASLLIPLSAAGPRLACFVIGSAAVSAGLAIGNVIFGSFRQAYCPPSMLGRVSASMSFFLKGTIPLGGVLAGVLGTVLGIRNGLWADLAIFAASALLLLTREIRSARDLGDW
jgi:predicted MFS family arabinose efflux permease